MFKLWIMQKEYEKTAVLEKKSLSDQCIIGYLSTHYNIEVVNFIFLPLGADMNSSVYKAGGKNGFSYFVKLKRDHEHDASAAIVEMLHDAGIEGIIAPIKTIRGQSFQRIDDFTIIVYPFLDGQDGFSCRLTDEQWIKLGGTLRKVHALTVPTLIQKEVQRETYSSQWRDALLSLYEHIEDEPAAVSLRYSRWQCIAK